MAAATSSSGAPGGASSDASAAPAVAVDTTLRVAAHFPKVLKPCKSVADPFFACFSEKSVQRAGGEPEAGQRALTECRTLMAAYDACMEKHLAGKSTVLYRVPEVYREGK